MAVGFGVEFFVGFGGVFGAGDGAADVNDIDAGMGDGANGLHVGTAIPADFDSGVDIFDDGDFFGLKHVGFAALATKIAGKNEDVVSGFDDVGEVARKSTFEEGDAGFDVVGFELVEEGDEFFVNFGGENTEGGTKTKNLFYVGGRLGGHEMDVPMNVGLRESGDINEWEGADWSEIAVDKVNLDAFGELHEGVHLFFEN